MTALASVTDLPAREPAQQAETVRDRVIRLAQKLEGPHDIARAVLEEVDPAPDGVREAFAEILPEYCRVVLINQRRAMNRMVLPDADDDAAPADGSTAIPTLATKSAKNAAIRDWFQKYLQLQLHVGDSWKRMGDCTKDDLLFGADERRRKASELRVRAAELEAIAVALDMHRKTHVRDLPESVLRSVLESAR